MHSVHVGWAMSNEISYWNNDIENEMYSILALSNMIYMYYMYLQQWQVRFALGSVVSSEESSTSQNKFVLASSPRQAEQTGH